MNPCEIGKVKLIYCHKSLCENYKKCHEIFSDARNKLNEENNRRPMGQQPHNNDFNTNHIVSGKIFGFKLKSTSPLLTNTKFLRDKLGIDTTNTNFYKNGKIVHLK